VGVLGFLEGLREHNDRDWVRLHQPEYEGARAEALALVSALQDDLHALSGRLLVGPASIGRIHRDTRFARDKRPYKSHWTLRFWHEALPRAEHAPAFHLRLEPGGSSLCAGLVRPTPLHVDRVRSAILAEPGAWRQSCLRLEVEGRQGRLPAGVDPGHPAAEDLRRRQFFCVRRFTDAEVGSPRFARDVAMACWKAAPLNAFLAEAMGLDW
jgi:uncharacterized protein (TIGR02453 family)